MAGKFMSPEEIESLLAEVSEVDESSDSRKSTEDDDSYGVASMVRVEKLFKRPPEQFKINLTKYKSPIVRREDVVINPKSNTVLTKDKLPVYSLYRLEKTSA